MVTSHDTSVEDFYYSAESTDIRGEEKVCFEVFWPAPYRIYSRTSTPAATSDTQWTLSNGGWLKVDRQGVFRNQCEVYLTLVGRSSSARLGPQRSCHMGVLK
jgi:hypothetical protein